MTDGDALLRAILSQPDEDTPRLVYADWLDEQGNRDDRDRAEFIRVQIAIAKRPHMDCLKDRGSYAPTTWHRFTNHCRCASCRLRRREYETSKRHCVWDWCRGIPAGSRPKYARGFVEALTCSASAWLSHADAITAAHPVREVALTTLPQVADRGDCFLLVADPEQVRIPTAVLDAVYPPDTLAHVCLRYRFPGIAFTLPTSAPSPA